MSRLLVFAGVFTLAAAALWQIPMAEEDDRTAAVADSAAADSAHVLNPTTRELEPIDSFGYYVAYKHRWAAGWQSNLVFGGAGVRNYDYQPPGAYKNGQYVALNLFRQVSAGMRAGLEYNWGRRESKDGQDGTANRIQYAVYYDF